MQRCQNGWKNRVVEPLKKRF